MTVEVQFHFLVVELNSILELMGGKGVALNIWKIFKYGRIYEAYRTLTEVDGDLNYLIAVFMLLEDIGGLYLCFC